MEKRLTSQYYSLKDYWKGFGAIKKLAQAAKVSEIVAKRWLFKQALRQIYLPAPRRQIPRPKFDVPTPNAVHQADLLFIPHDKLPRGCKVFKYVPTIVDVASRFKEAEPLTSKNSDETFIQHGRPEIHRDQAIVKRFNCTLAERLFGHQYAVEMRLPEGQRSTVWVKRLPEVVSALNEVTRLIGEKPTVAIKEKAVYSRPLTTYSRPLGVNEKKLPSDVNVHYLYQPGELEGGVKRVTDPIWSLKVFTLERSITKPNKPVVYYLRDGPKRGFVREELLVIPPNTALPPTDVN